MSKQIVLKSFSALSFELIIRQAPVQAVHGPPPTATRSPGVVAPLNSEDSKRSHAAGQNGAGVARPLSNVHRGSGGNRVVFR